MHPKIPLAFLVAKTHYWFMFNSCPQSVQALSVSSKAEVITSVGLAAWNWYKLTKNQNFKPGETLPAEFKLCIKLQIQLGGEVSFNSFLTLTPVYHQSSFTASSLVLGDFCCCFSSENPQKVLHFFGDMLLPQISPRMHRLCKLSTETAWAVNEGSACRQGFHAWEPLYFVSQIVQNRAMKLGLTHTGSC